MRILSIGLLLVGTSLAATAQTNSPASRELSMQDKTARELSMQDAIQMALKHNLDLQIERYSPMLSRYSLEGQYGAYDPTFTFSGEHDHDEAGSRLLGGGFSIPGSTSDSGILGGSFMGLLPWGTSYRLFANANDTHGESPTLVNDPTQPILGTNSFVDINTGQTISIRTTNYAQIPMMRSFENSSGRAGIGVSQPLLKNFLIDAPRLNIRVSKNRLKQSELTLQQQVMQIVTSLEQSYYDLITARENVSVQAKAVELAERLVAENRKRVEVGALAPLDEKQAEAQAATTRSELIAAKARLAVQENVLKRLITDNFGQWAEVELVPTGSLEAPRRFFNVQDSWSKGLTKRPELLLAKIDLDTAGIQLKYTKNQLLPQLDIFGSYGYNGSGQEFSGALEEVRATDRPFWTAGGSISLPLSNRTARNNYYAQKVSVEQAILSVKRIEQQIMAQIDDDIKTAQSAFEAVASTRSAREYAQSALDAEQKKLESGKSTTYTVLQMQRDLTNARAQEITALGAYNRLLSRLSLDEGTTLERLNINFETK
jgi:outer membrane protein TolC